MLRELKTFLAVAQHGTFAAAGLHVGLTQSAVSAQIRNLEQALSVRLFDRTGRQAIDHPAIQLPQLAAANNVQQMSADRKRKALLMKVNCQS